MDFTQYQMINRYERIRALPESELDRRWATIRNLMKKHDVNVMVFANTSENGTSLWLLGASNKHPDYIIFPMDDTPVAIYSGKSQTNGQFNPYVFVGRTRIEPGAYGKVKNANEFSSEMVCKYVSKDKARIGFSHPSAMDVTFRRKLLSAMPNLEIIDMTHEISRARSIKSLYDIEVCKASAEMHRIFLEAVPSIVRPGRTQKDVNNDLRKLAMDFGSGGEDMCLMMKIVDKYHNRRLATPWSAMQNRRFQNDDMFWILLETSGPGGQFCANARYWSFTEPSKEFSDRLHVAVKAQEMAGELLRTDVTIRSVADTVNAFIRASGYYTDNCCFIHSLGYAMGEYPMLSDNSVATDPKSIDEDEPLQNGTIMIAHPQVGIAGKGKIPRQDMVLVIDTYMIEDKGTAHMTKAPRGLYLIG